MAVTDDQLDDLKTWAFELGRDGVLADPKDADIVSAVFDRAEVENVRTEDEFDAIITPDDLPAHEDHDDIVAAYNKGCRIREYIWLMLDRSYSAQDIRDNLDGVKPAGYNTDELEQAIDIIEAHPKMTSVNDLTR